MYIFMAGAEAWSDQFIDAGVRYMLGTFYYLRTSRAKHAILGDWQRYKAKHPDRRIFLDSGAFTFQTQRADANPDDYFREYAYFLKHNHKVFDIVAELDIDELVGMERVLDYREKLIKIVGSKLCAVWHKSHSRESLGEWSKDQRFRWIALSSDVSESVGLSMSLIATAQRHKKYVHVLGQTRVQTDLKYISKANSVDSTSWLRATKYGTTFVYKGGANLIANNAPKDSGKKQAFRRTHKRHFMKLGLDFEKILADDPKEVAKSAIIAWRDFAIRMHALGQMRGSSKVDWTYGGLVNAPQGSDTMEEKPKSGGKLRIKLALNAEGQLIPTKAVIESTPTPQTPLEGPLDASQPGAEEGVLTAPARPKKRPKKGHLYALGQRLRGVTPEEQPHLDVCPVCNQLAGKTHILTIGQRTGGVHEGSDLYVDRTGHLSCWQSIGSPSVWPSDTTNTTPASPPQSESGAVHNAPLAEEIGKAGGEGAGAGDNNHTGKEGEGGNNQHMGIDAPAPQVTGVGLSVHQNPQGTANSGEKRSLPVLQAKNYPTVSPDVDALFDSLPKLNCTTCAMQGTCPEFMEGAVCAYLPILEGLNVRDRDQVIGALHQLAVVQFKRALVAYMQEQSEAGGALDPRVTNQLQVAREALQECLNMMKATSPEAVPTRITVEQHQDGTQKVSATINPQDRQGGGMLAKLFGAPASPFADETPAPAAIVDVKPAD